MRKLLSLILLLAAPLAAEPRVKIPEPKPKPIYERDLVSVGAAKMQAMLAPDSLNRYPQNATNNTFSGNNLFTGTNEFDGTTNFDGAVDFDGAIDASSTALFSGVVTFGSAAGAADSLSFGTFAGCLAFEGAADASEFGLCLGSTDADASLSVTVNSGVMALSSGSTTLSLTGSSNIVLQTPTYFGTTVSAANAGILAWNAAQTVDTLTLALGTTSRHLVLIESGDEGFDFAHAQQTNPTLFVHSAAQSTTQWLSLAHDGTHSRISAGTGQIALDPGSSSHVTITLNKAFASTQTTPAQYPLFYPGLSVLTPDSGAIAAGTLANSLHIVESGDTGFDFNNGRAGTGIAGNPSLIVHSADQTVTEYLQISTETVAGMGKLESNFAGDYIGGFKNNITEAAATSIVQIGFGAATMFGATVFYTVSDSDGTDHIARSGNIVIQGVNKAGTETCTISSTRDQETEDGSSVAQTAALTLTYTWTLSTTPTNACDLQLNYASNAGANTGDITYTLQLMGTSAAITVTPQ